MSKSSVGPTKDQSLSVREISNGFIVSTSGQDAKGKYSYKEEYTPTKPKIEINAAPKAQRAAPMSSLAKAMQKTK